MKIKKILISTFLISTINISNLFAMQVSPIKVFINDKHKVQNLNITNNSNSEKTYQSIVYKWDMKQNGKTNLTETTPFDIMASPLVFKLKPNETQSIKIGKMQILPNKQENYRIIVKDITPSKVKGIAIKMASSIPIFISHETSVNDKKNIKTSYIIKNNKIFFTIQNNTNTFQELSKIKFNKNKLISRHFYILPHHKLTFNMNINKLKITKKLQNIKLIFLNNIEINMK
jgi:P pilus assembly chaperone PapD